MSLLSVGVIFGGRSVEHEVSVITAHQVMAALPTDRYKATPIYISKSGQWFMGESLLDLKNFRDLEKLVSLVEPVVFNVDATQPGLIRLPFNRAHSWFGNRSQARSMASVPIDIAFPLVHGTHGEDGTLQGLFELANLAYVGGSVSSSAIGMDKLLTKLILREASLSVLPDLSISRVRWEAEPDTVIEEIESHFSYPVMIKPISLGSSVGVSRANDVTELRFALDVAAHYDSRLMVEPALQEIFEINCAVMGDGFAPPRVSVCEQPVTKAMLSYEDKYLSGKSKSQGMKSAQRLIPAPIDAQLTEAIQSVAMQAFTAIGASGVARVDFLVCSADKKFFVNEINTIPGSLAFYLWEPIGISFPHLVEDLLEIALKRHTEKQRSTFSFSSSLLSSHQLAGSKVLSR